MSHLILFDPSIMSRNLGDQIISESVRRILRSTLPGVHMLTSTTQEAPGWKSANLAKTSLVNIVGGSNCLTPHRFRYSMWKIGLPALIRRVQVLLLGVGSHGVDRPDCFSSGIYRWVLSTTLVHSCRDEVTAAKVRSLGRRAINTGCPTMWELDKEHCRQIPAGKSEHAIFTFTDYLRDPQADLEMLRQLRRSYTKLTFWPQGLMDLSYLRSLTGGDLRDIQILDPRLDSFTTFLQSHECDYIGTRLHAGIKALQHARRALIIGIDNRTASITADTGLPMLVRNDIGRLSSTVSAPIPTNLRLPWNEIQLWRSQVRKLVTSLKS